MLDRDQTGIGLSGKRGIVIGMQQRSTDFSMPAPLSNRGVGLADG